MKRTVLLLGCLLSMGLYAQTSPNGVYSTTEPRPTVLEKPASREIMGGTVIRVNFDETNAISATQKGELLNMLVGFGKKISLLLFLLTLP